MPTRLALGFAVYSLSVLVLAVLGALLAGIFVGVLASRHMSPDIRRQRELERSLANVSRQQKDYRHEIAEHFADAAKLLHKLAGSYRDVHNHLAAGADKLAGNQAKPLLEPLPEGDPPELGSAVTVSRVEQPLDYAPRQSPHERGVLNEEFGLDEAAASEDAGAQSLADAEVSKKAGNQR